MTDPIRITDPAALSQAVRDLRADSGLSQSAFAARVGVSRKQVEMWLAGKNLPGAHSMLKLAEALGCDLAFIPREEPQ